MKKDTTTAASQPSAKPARRWIKILNTHALAFAMGAVLSAWGMFFYTQRDSTNPRPPVQADKPGDPMKDALAQRDKAEKQAGKTKAEPSAADPFAEAERINELNRRNLQRIGQPYVPGAARPDDGRRPGSRAPSPWQPPAPGRP